jgi:hypothetical protein
VVETVAETEPKSSRAGETEVTMITRTQVWRMIVMRKMEFLTVQQPVQPKRPVVNGK